MPSMHSIARTVMMVLRWRNMRTTDLLRASAAPSMRTTSMTVTYALRWLHLSRQSVAARREERWRQFHFAGILATYCRRWLNRTNFADGHQRQISHPTCDQVVTSNTIAERVSGVHRGFNCVRCRRERANLGFVTCGLIHPLLLCQECGSTEERCPCCPEERILNFVLLVSGRDFLRSSVQLSFSLNCVECRTRVATVPFPFCTHPPLICRLCQLMNNLTRCPYCRR